MRHVDFSPLYRSTVGFDRLFTMLDSLGQPESAQTYPPYNIERTGEDAYRISMAVAGFAETDIGIEAHRNVLTVKGERKEEADGEGSELLYRGIASRAFERRFQLADHVDVVGAALKNGLLFVDLKRNIPEELKPRKIAITSARVKAKQIEAKARWNLAAEAAALRKGVEAALRDAWRSQVNVTGSLDAIDVRDFALTNRAVLASVIVGGELQVGVGSRAGQP